MFNYKWEIQNFEVLSTDTFINTITKINWKYIALDDDNTEIDYEYSFLYLDHSDLTEFIKFEELTEEIIISWLESKLSTQDLQTSIEMRYKQDHSESNMHLKPETVSPPWINNTLSINSRS
jgi:hypothetical protein